MSATPITLRLRSKRFLFVRGEATLHPLVDGYAPLTGEVRNNEVTGVFIQPGASLYALLLNNMSVVAGGRSEPATVPKLLLPDTILLSPTAVATGVVDIALDARTIASVRLLAPAAGAGGPRTLSVAQSGRTLEVLLDSEDRAAILLDDGAYSFSIDPRRSVVHVVVDQTSPAWLDVMLN